VFGDRALIRNDAFGKGAFGSSRNGDRTHKGIDLLVKLGNPVTAAKSGRVSHAGLGKGYGWYVELRHPDGRVSRYAHLGQLSVSVGEWVVAGQRLGTAGKSGNADDPAIRPHVHFEIRKKDQALDPLGGLMEPSLIVR
jgi:murein DD-endopeptidase MepM/ murein hydrolase activator NlpD